MVMPVLSQVCSIGMAMICGARDLYQVSHIFLVSG